MEIPQLQSKGQSFCNRKEGKPLFLPHRLTPSRGNRIKSTLLCFADSNKAAFKPCLALENPSAHCCLNSQFVSFNCRIEEITYIDEWRMRPALPDFSGPLRVSVFFREAHLHQLLYLQLPPSPHTHIKFYLWEGWGNTLATRNWALNHCLHSKMPDLDNSIERKRLTWDVAACADSRQLVLDVGLQASSHQSAVQSQAPKMSAQNVRESF